MYIAGQVAHHDEALARFQQQARSG
jgi:hypothetical protein